MEPGTLIPLLSAAAGGLIWLVRLEGQVRRANECVVALEEKIGDAVKAAAHSAAHVEEAALRLDAAREATVQRIEEKMEEQTLDVVQRLAACETQLTMLVNGRRK